MPKRAWDDRPLSESNFFGAIGDYPTLTEEQKDKARRYVASKSTSREDLTVLLSMLGLLSEQDKEVA